MKIIIELIKTVIISMLVMFSISANSQTEAEKRDMFVRVYNLEGKKFAKGYIVSVNDDVLVLKKNYDHIEIQYQDIGRIKTKRSEGNNVLTGVAIGTAAGVALGVATADPDAFLGYSAGEGALAFGVIGAVGGGAIGGVSIAFKKHESIYINGELEKWLVFKELINNLKK